MNNVSNVGTSNIPHLTNFAADPSQASLTPDMLLVYCSTRLQTIDSNIKQYFAEQERRNGQIRQASKLMEILQSGTWGNGHVGPDQLKVNKNQRDDHARKANEILAVWRSSDSPEIREACAKAFRSVSGHDIGAFAGKDAEVTGEHILTAASEKDRMKFVSREEWAPHVESLKNIQSDMMKSAELNMIQLQSLVSQRQLAVQLTTQLMQTLNETSKQVVGNIR